MTIFISLHYRIPGDYYNKSSNLTYNTKKNYWRNQEETACEEIYEQGFFSRRHVVYMRKGVNIIYGTILNLYMWILSQLP